MAHLGLPNAVDAPKALLQPVRVPRQIVIDHQVRPLKIDALARRVGRQQHLHLRVVAKRLLGLQALLTAHPTVNGDDGLGAPQQGRHTVYQIVQRVAVFREHDELLAGRRGRRRNRPHSVGCRLLGQMVRDSRRGEDLTEQAGKLAPLAILAAAAHRMRQRLQAAQGGDLTLQLINRAGGGRLVQHLGLNRLDLVLGGVL